MIILGDSYSTFEKFVPDGNRVYYFENGNRETDVTSVEQTWWYQVAQEANLNLILNDSWSGSTIGYTGFNNADRSTSTSFIYRLHKLIEENFFNENEINTVFVFGGTNDSWADAPLGTMQYQDWKKQDLYFVLPAICYFFKTLKDYVPNADIYCLINTEMKPEISAGMKKACQAYGITEITFETIDKNCGHPTVKGMKDIKKTVLDVLKKNEELKIV